MGELSQGERREGRLAGGLADNRAPSSQSGGNLPRDHGRREIPGRDEAAHADGLLGGDDAVRSNGAIDGVAVDAGRLLAKPLEEVGGVGGLALGVAEGLAVLPGDELGNVVGVGDDLVVPLAQQLRALAAGLAPEGREGVGGG